MKRFLAETSSKKVVFIPEGEGNEMILASTQYLPKIKIVYNKHLRATKHLPDKVEAMNDFIDVKGLKAQGNQLTKLKVKDVLLMAVVEGEEWPVPEVEEIPVVVDAELISEDESTETTTSESIETEANTKEETASVESESAEDESPNESSENPETLPKKEVVAKKKPKSTKKKETGSGTEVVGSSKTEESVTFEFDGDDVASNNHSSDDDGEDSEEDKDEGQTSMF
ncbi:MAG: hypothetical protein JKY54_09840 [Flavobacteriales bacterium]|nr:hypothetical protein [Flavobacteriales bacterium]